MATITENLQTIIDSKAAIKDAIEAKGVAVDDAPLTQYASKIEEIEQGASVGVKRVSYLRRTNEGYIDTGVSGANDNLKIMVRYAMRVFPTGYWRFITAYEDESTNTTRIILNKNTQLLGNINSVATGGTVTLNRAGYTGVIYTDIIEPTSSTSFRLSSNGASVSKTRTSGKAINRNIHIFPNTTDTIDVELYQCKIYDGETLIRDFYPCKINDEFGLWDTVTQQFYGNDGDGKFSGEIITIGSLASEGENSVPDYIVRSSVPNTGNAAVYQFLKTLKENTKETANLEIQTIDVNLSAGVIYLSDKYTVGTQVYLYQDGRAISYSGGSGD